MYKHIAITALCLTLVVGQCGSGVEGRKLAQFDWFNFFQPAPAPVPDASSTPEANTLEYYAVPGPLEPSRTSIRGGVLYYPVEIANLGELSVVGVSYHMTSNCGQYDLLLNHLASHGFIAVCSSANSGNAMVNAFQEIESLNENPDSELYNHVKADSFGIGGVSLGGMATTRAAASEFGRAKIKAAIPIAAPGEPVANGIVAPTLWMYGSGDFQEGSGRGGFSRMSAPSIYLVKSSYLGHNEFANGLFSYDRDSNYLFRHFTAFMKLYLDEELELSSIFWGDGEDSVANDGRMTRVLRDSKSSVKLTSESLELKDANTATNTAITVVASTDYTTSALVPLELITTAVLIADPELRDVDASRLLNVTLTEKGEDSSSIDLPGGSAQVSETRQLTVSFADDWKEIIMTEASLPLLQLLQKESVRFDISVQLLNQYDRGTTASTTFSVDAAM